MTLSQLPTSATFCDTARTRGLRRYFIQNGSGSESSALAIASTIITFEQASKQASKQAGCASRLAVLRWLIFPVYEAASTPVKSALRCVAAVTEQVLDWRQCVFGFASMLWQARCIPLVGEQAGHMAKQHSERG